GSYRMKTCSACSTWAPSPSRRLRRPSDRRHPAGGGRIDPHGPAEGAAPLAWDDAPPVPTRRDVGRGPFALAGRPRPSLGGALRAPAAQRAGGSERALSPGEIDVNS